MAGGIKALRFIQIGKETTAGTAVAATTIWRGLGMIADNRDVVFPNEDIGYLSGVDRSYVPKLEAALKMDAVPATFEQLPYILNAGVKGVAGSQDGTNGSGYSYSYAFPTTARNTLYTYTIEGGDDQQEEEMEYAFVEAFQISGKFGEALTMQADWIGRQVAPSTKTGSLSVPTVEEILFGKGALYIDTAGGTAGTTLKSNTLIGMDLKVKTGWHPVYTADQLYFSYHEADMPEVTCDITFEHDATAVAEKAAWRAQTVRQIQLKWTGASLTTSGTYTTKLLQIDLAGKWDKFDVIGEQNGNDIVKGTFRARYDSTAAKFATLLLVNELSALP